jgi:hypothetical protein
MTTKTFCSVKLVSTKVVENFVSFPERIRTQIFEFVCGGYDQNTELDRDKFEKDEITCWKSIRCQDATPKLNQEHDLNQQYDFDYDTSLIKLILKLNLLRLKGDIGQWKDDQQILFL